MWKNLSIKKKFLACIIIIALSTILNIVFSVFSLSRIASNYEDYTRAVDLNQELLMREQQHLQWVNNLSIYLVSEQPVEVGVVKDSHQCGFGTWYYGEGRAKAEAAFPIISANLRAIEAPHQELHATAQDIENLVMSGQIAQAHEIFQNRTIPALQAVQKELTEVRALLQSATQAEADALNAQIGSAFVTALVFGVINCLAIVFLAVILIRNTMKPIEQITQYSLDCLAGKDSHIDLDRGDELGVLAKNLTALMEHLGEQLAFSQGLMQGMAVPCSVFSPQDKTVFTNRQMLDLIERSGEPEQYYGMSSGEFIWGDKNSETLSTKAMREDKALTAEREITTHKGNKRNVRISSAPFHDKNGSILGTLSIWLDLTETVQKQLLIEADDKRIAEVAASARSVSQSVSEASSEISAQVEQASRGSAVQRDRVGTTAAAMSEMNATVMEVARNAASTAELTAAAKEKAQEGAVVVSHLLRGIDDVTHAAGAVKDGMTGLSQQARGVGTIINVINDIADQTNLLALNAAIEAARAGEAGRGFAVVADEVRKLAEKTMEATREVGQVVSGIQAGTDTSMQNVEIASMAVQKVAELAQQTGASLEQIVGLVENSAAQVHSIATAAEEQSATSNEINATVGEVARISDQTSAAMREAARAVEELSIQATKLNELIENL